MTNDPTATLRMKAFPQSDEYKFQLTAEYILQYNIRNHQPCNVSFYCIGAMELKVNCIAVLFTTSISDHNVTFISTKQESGKK